jgi:ribosomal protein L30/L7E
MIAIIRIHGRVGLDKKIAETFNRLMLRRKYSCIVIEKPDLVQLGMLKNIKDFTAYGEINEETLKKLNEKRKGKIKNFFRLHPPRGGIDAKKHFGTSRKGVLGDNKNKMNELIERML